MRTEGEGVSKLLCYAEYHNYIGYSAHNVIQFNFTVAIFKAASYRDSNYVGNEVTILLY